MRAASVIPERRLRALFRRPASTVVLSRVLLMPQVCHGRPHGQGHDHETTGLVPVAERRLVSDGGRAEEGLEIAHQSQ